MLCPRRGYVLCVCVFARMFVCASVCSFGCQLVSLCSVMLCPCLCFVWFLVLCCMLTTSNRPPPLPCHLLAAVLESKGRCNSNGNSRGNAGRPYTFWPSLQTHISRSVNAAPRPLGVKTTEVSHWKSWSFPGACLTLKASHGRYEAKPHNKA